MSEKSLREKHIDRFLAEEFTCSPRFTKWFAGKALDRNFSDEISNIRAQTSFIRKTGDKIGETDIRVKFEYVDQQVVILHIEDKIDANPQEKQAERYLQTIENERQVLEAEGKSPVVGCVLICPEYWQRRHPRESELYETQITFEEMAKYFRDRAIELNDIGSVELAHRMKWRSELLDGTQKRRSLRTMLANSSEELNDWNKFAAEIIQVKNGVHLRVSARQKVAGASAKESRHILFDEKLPDAKGGSVRLKLKTASSTKPCFISLEIPDASKENALIESALQNGFTHRMIGSGTLIVNKSGETLKDLVVSKQASAQIEALEEAADVSLELISWWEKQDAFHK